MPPSPTLSATKQEIMDRVRAMAQRFAERAAAAEEARRIPEELVKDMLDARLCPHPGAEERRRLWPRLRHLVRGHARALQGRCVAWLVRQPDHPPQPSDRAVSASRAAGAVGQRSRCAGRGVVRAGDGGRAGRRRLSRLRKGLAVRQRRRSLHLGHARRHGAGRRHAGVEILPGRARRLHHPRHLVHRRHARHRQQDHRHRQRLRAERAGAEAGGLARRQNAGRRHAQRHHLPHAVLLLCADLVRDADARRGAGRLRAFPRLDQDAPRSGRLIGRRENLGPGAHGARRRRPRCRRSLAAARRWRDRHAARLFAAAPGALGARFRPRVRADGFGDRHARSP